MAPGVRIPYNLFPIILAAFFIMETSLLTASASHCTFPRSMVCSRYPLPVLSALSAGSSASSAHSTISAVPARIQSSTYRCTVLPQEANSLCLTTIFNSKMQMFILVGFIHHLTQLFRHMKAIEYYFLNHIG